MLKRRFRVLAVATHPVPCRVPISRLAAREDLDLQVAYGGLRGAEDQDFVLNAHLRLSLGLVFRLPKLAQAAQTSSGGAPFDRGTR
jgi:hypothetical protein